MDTKSLRTAAQAEMGRNGYSWMSPEHVIEMLDEIDATNIEEAADEIERLRGELLALQNTNVWHLRAKMAEEKLSRYEQSMSCKDCGATEPSHKPDCPQLA